MVITLPAVTENILRLINECKSDSGTSGAKLREAHYKLGRELAKYINQKEQLDKNNSIKIFIMMRAGLFFGIGISDELESLGNTVHTLLSSNNTIKYLDNNDKIIIVDAVINSGETVINLLQALNNKEVIVATNVISSSHIDRFNDINTYATRISEKSYKGSNNKTISNGKGPDTGDRLFTSNFYE